MQQQQQQVVTTALDAVLERNLKAMMAHRPGLFQLVVTAPLRGRFQTIVNARGEPTVAAMGLFRDLTPVMPNADPVAHVRRSEPSIPTAVNPVILAGAGDGALVAVLASLRPSHNPLGVAQPVIVVEPETELLLRALQCHDLSALDGPFVDPRFSWCVGPDWENELRRVLLAGMKFGFPKHVVSGGSARPELEAAIARLRSEYREHVTRVQQQVNADCAARAAEYASAIKGRAGRPPRVLLITSLFTTVLRFSTQNLAEAFAALGWETALLQEQEGHHRLSKLQMLDEVKRARPDLVVIIDRLRHDFEGVFPPELPYVCWVQDELPAISCEAAARTIAPRDFVWLGPKDHYERQWGYPERQLIQSRCFTTPRAIPESWPERRHDLVYLSHASKSRAQILQEPLAWRASHGLDGAILERLGQALAARYDAGGVVFDLRAFVAEVEPSLGPWEPRKVEWVNGRARLLGGETLLDRYAQPFYLAASWLHRQQGLRWAAELARERGLDLALYGHGWNEVPEFADLARGAVDYRTELVPLLQSSRACLHLEPWSVVAHWRGLDALASGVPILARKTPQQSVLQRIARLLELAPEAASLAELERALRDSHAAALAEIAVDLAWLSFPAIDPVAHVRELCAAGLQPSALTLPARLEPWTFSSKEELAASLDALVSRPAESRALALNMREDIITHYSYERGARELIAAVSDRL